MAFVLQNLAQFTLANSAAPSAFTYSAGDDTVSQVAAANYFSEAANRFQVGTLLYCVCDDADAFRTVTAVNLDVFPNTVTTSAFAVEGPIGTADIEDLAVTAAKIASATITATQMANSAVTTAIIANNAVTSAKLALDTIQRTTVALNNAQLLALNATSVSAIAAPGANLGIVVDKVVVRHNFLTGAFTGSGNVGLQYGSTAALAAPAASATIAETGLFTAAVNTAAAAGGTISNIAVTAWANTAVYISASTALAAGGGSATVDIWYKVIATA